MGCAAAFLAHPKRYELLQGRFQFLASGRDNPGCHCQGGEILRWLPIGVHRKFIIPPRACRWWNNILFLFLFLFLLLASKGLARGFKAPSCLKVK